MKKRFTTLCCLIFLTGHLLHAANIYVDSIAMNDGDGLSWATAFNDLQEALAIAQSGDTIHVGQGTYKPDSPGGDPASTFLIGVDLILLGGYPSGGGVRNPEVYETILSGDLNGDDVDDQAGAEKADNVMTVVTVASTGPGEVVLDGFIIRNGYADGTTASLSNYWGGGIYASGNLTLRNCAFFQNVAVHKGGAIFAKDGHLTMEGCILKKNRANTGGGLRLDDAQYLIENCVFQFNTAQLASWENAWGGGAFIWNSSGEVKECTFRENLAQHHGGGLGVYSNTSFSGAALDLVNCLFENNVTEQSGGGVYLNSRGELSDYSVSGCSFSDNTGLVGGAMRIIAANPSSHTLIELDSCQFSHNQATSSEGGGIIALLNGVDVDFRMSNTSFHNNSAEFGGGGATIYARTNGGEGNGEARIEGCEFLQNTTSAIAGGMTLGSFSGVGDFSFLVSECLFSHNQTATYAGGLDLFGRSPGNVVVENSIFEQNEAGETGGGIGLATNSDVFFVSVRHCQILDNDSPFGAAIGADVFYADDTTGAFTQAANIRFEHCLLSGNIGEYAVASRKTGTLRLINCTVADNHGSALGLDSLAVATMQNCILSNTGTEYQALSDDAFLFSFGGNLIRDGSLGNDLNPEDHENVEDPKFMGMGDDCTFYQLSADSRGIDEGVELADAAAQDLCGNDRVQGNRIDIGALESPFTSSSRELMADNVMVYPNPATDLLNIEWPETLYNPMVTITNPLGKVVKQQLLVKGQVLQIGTFAPGAYTLEMVEDGQVYIGKLVKH